MVRARSLSCSSASQASKLKQRSQRTSCRTYAGLRGEGVDRRHSGKESNKYHTHCSTLLCASFCDF